MSHVLETSGGADRGAPGRDTAAFKRWFGPGKAIRMSNRTARTRGSSKAFTLVHGIAAAFAVACVVVAPGASQAAAALLQPSTDHCLSDAMAMLSESPANDLTAGERRVVLWLVHQILSAEDDDKATLEFTDREVSVALGIDIRGLDRDRIREHVRAMLVGPSCQRALELLD